MTDLILKINGIEDAVSVEFYVEREKTVKFLKDELIRVFKENAVEYYAPVNANELGRGHLMAAVEFDDRERRYPGGTRRVVLSGFTGYTIPCMGEGNMISCDDYEVSFEVVEDIPKNDAMIYYGIGDLDNIDLYSMTGVKEIDEVDFTFNAGESIVIAIPYDRDEVAKKDNGFGEGIEFSTQVKGKNGEFYLIDSIVYKVYGEFMTIDGVLKVYIK